MSRWEFLGYVVVISLATYALAPKDWEPGGESLKYWVQARIFRETGEFPVFRYGPLYNIYLQLFLSFDYPLSIQLEQFVTHLFTYVSIFLLLRRFLSGVPALLLACAWIPTLWIVEGGARVAGIGFLALYLRADNQSALNKGYLPVPLVAAALCAQAFIWFLLGHIVGTIMTRRSNKEPIVGFAYPLTLGNIPPVIVKAALVLLVVLAVSFQSQRKDNNVYGFHYPWAPVHEIGILSVASFTHGNWKYVMRNVPESEWIYQDWYFTHEKAFGGASNLLQAVLNNPELFYKNIISNVPSAVLIPFKFMVGFSFPVDFIGMFLFLLSWVLLPVSLYRVFQYFNTNNLVPWAYSIAFGTIAVCGALFFLVSFVDRYVMVLLPVGLLIVAHTGASLQSLITSMRKGLSNRFNSPSML